MGECLDIDECMENTHLCVLDSDCINNDGSYECECYEGFVGDGFRECINDNECLHRNDKCPENAYCVDTIGSYECQCFDGYTDVGSGFAFNCENIDECDMEAHRCGANSTCIDTDGSYKCGCEKGFEYTGTDKDTEGNIKLGADCIDINECATNTHDCSHACANTEGSFECVCRVGFRQYKRNSCENINECHDHCDVLDFSDPDHADCKDFIHKCHPTGICVDTIGSYDCICDDAYEGNGWFGCSLHFPPNTECKRSKTNYNSNFAADNFNVVGKGDRNGGTAGFDGSEIRMEECDELQCKPGWQGNPYACEDVDECFDNLHECDLISSECSNLPGSYQCICTKGFRGTITKNVMKFYGPSNKNSVI